MEPPPLNGAVPTAEAAEAGNVAGGSDRWLPDWLPRVADLIWCSKSENGVDGVRKQATRKSAVISKSSDGRGARGHTSVDRRPHVVEGVLVAAHRVAARAGVSRDRVRSRPR